MNEFQKKLILTIEPDKLSLSNTEKEIDLLAKDFSKTQIDELKKNLVEAFKFSMPEMRMDDFINSDELSLDFADEDISDLLKRQAEVYSKLQEEYGKSIDALNNAEIIRLQEENDRLQSMIDAKGLEGQLQIYEERNRLEEEILELSILDTEEAKKKTEELKKQIDFIDKQYDIFAKPEEEKEDSENKALSFAQTGLNTASQYGDFAGSEFTSMTSGLSGVLSGFSKGFLGGLAATGVLFLKSFSDIMKEGEEAARELAESNRMSSRSTRETMFEWGTNRSGAYGISAAMDIFGYQSQEDVMWASATNPEEFRRFLNVQTTFANKYIELQNSGKLTKMLDAQIEMAELEYEMQIEEAEFYAENIELMKEMKELGLNFKKSMMTILSPIANAINSVAKFLGASSSDSNTRSSDVAAPKAISTSTYSVKVDNSFNSQSAVASDKTSLENTLMLMLNAVGANIE